MFEHYTKKNIYIYLILFWIFMIPCAFAQNKGKAVPQKLEWARDENVLEYTVEVRNKQTGEVKSFTTQDNFLEISEAPGNYEFRVKTVDILGREGKSSGWQSFKITKALMPDIASAPAGSWVIPESAEDSAVIPVQIKNISPRTKVQLVNAKTGEVVDGELITTGTGASALASGIKVPVLPEGDWKIKVTDASGKFAESAKIKISNPWPEIRRKRAEEEEKARRLEEERIAEEKRRAEEELRLEEERRAEEERLAEENRLRQEEEARLAEEKARLEEEQRLAEEKKQEEEALVKETNKGFDFDLAVGYTLPVILFDELIPEYMESRIWPISACVKADAIPLKTSFGNIGAGLTGTYTRMNADLDAYSIHGNLITAHLNLVYQIPIFIHKGDAEKIRQAFAIELYGGAGFTGLIGFESVYQGNVPAKTLDSINLSFDAGFAVKFFVTKMFFIDAGCGFSYAMMKDAKLGLLLPELCAGVRF